MYKFEDNLLNTIKNIEFKDVKCNFQSKLRKDIMSIKKSDRLYMYVPADKTNYYQMKDDYTTPQRKYPGGVLSSKVYPGTCRWNGSQNQPPGITMTPSSVQKLV